MHLLGIFHKTINNRIHAKSSPLLLSLFGFLNASKVFCSGEDLLAKNFESWKRFSSSFLLMF